MKRLATWVTLAAAALVGAACDRPHNPGTELEIAYRAQYGGADGTKLMFENDAETAGGPRAVYNIPGFIPASDGFPDMSEMLGYPLVDCSNSEVRCIQIGLHAVMAVPRRDMALGQSFNAAGATLSVVGCSDATCSRAFITTRCARWEMMDKDGMSFRCLHGDTGGAADADELSFVYDHHRGIVLLRVEGDCPPPFVAPECSEGAFVIESQSGLLARLS
jgi:hypothetical protein